MQKRTQQVHKHALETHKNDTQTVHETHAQNTHDMQKHTQKVHKKIMQILPKIHKHTASS